MFLFHSLVLTMQSDEGTIHSWRQSHMDTFTTEFLSELDASLSHNSAVESGSSIDTTGEVC